MPNQYAPISPLTGIFKRGNALHAYLDKKCDTWPSVMTQWKDNACRGPLIGASITVPMRPLEVRDAASYQ